MNRTPHLIEQKLAELEQHTFYRQRFDACPHFMFFVGVAHGSDTNHSKYPYGQRLTCAYFSQNKADWYHLFSELKYTANSIVAQATKHPTIAKKMIAEFRPWENKFYKKCREIKKISLSKLTNQQLLTQYKELEYIYVKKLNSSPLIDGFALTTDTIIAQELSYFLEKKNLLKQFSTCFETLIAPTFISFLQQEEIAFLQMLGKIEQHPKNKEKLLKTHQQQFFWIQNNYVTDNILSLSFFEQRITRYTNINPNTRIQEIKRNIKEHKTKKQQLIKTLKIPKEITLLLHITDLFNYWQDERKKSTFWATHYFSLFLDEISTRTNYTLDELKYALPPEIDQILNQKIPKIELQTRQQACLLIWILDHYDITTDKRIIQLIRKEAATSSTHTQEIRGLTVSLGQASGTVKIVESVQDIHKIKKGDILVSVMTRPDYISAMEKAAAFITDEGGITCHAAIIARELRIPCIVGTRIATKVLKDGDLVKVDANHGVIKIVEKPQS